MSQEQSPTVRAVLTDGIKKAMKNPAYTTNRFYSLKDVEWKEEELLIILPPSLSSYKLSKKYKI